MGKDDKKPSAEREQTDSSLRIERRKADRALIERRAVSQADSVLQLARKNADVVLDVARDRADDLLQGLPVHASSLVARDRRAEDEALQGERDVADAVLRDERAEDRAALERLLPLERDNTDRYLLTERNRSDEALENRDDFLSIVAHDLRNLLAGIVLSAAQCAQAAPNSAETVNGSSRIDRYAARMNRLIGDLVDVASIESGKLAVATVSADLSSVVVEAVETFQSAAQAKGLSIEAETPAEPLMARFDHDRLLQVLANLISNSLKFTRRGGAIRVRCAPHDGALLVEVHDNGTGIPEPMLESVFERFWQVGENDRRGLGLGLYISKSIVEAHGGTIHVESSLGEWTRVFFTLPA